MLDELVSKFNQFAFLFRLNQFAFLFRFGVTVLKLWSSRGGSSFVCSDRMANGFRILDRFLPHVQVGQCPVCLRDFSPPPDGVTLAVPRSRADVGDATGLSTLARPSRVLARVTISFRDLSFRSTTLRSSGLSLHSVLRTSISRSIFGLLGLENGLRNPSGNSSLALRPGVSWLDGSIEGPRPESCTT